MKKGSKQRPFQSPRPQEDVYRASARMGFLAAVAREIPAASDGLSKIQPLYDRLADAGDEHWRTAHGLLDAPRTRAMAEAAAPSPLRDQTLEMVMMQESLLAAFTAWAKPYHLHRDPWIFEYVVAHLKSARTLGRAIRLGHGVAGVAYWAPAAQHAPSFPHYDPDFETRAEWRSRVDAHAEAYADVQETAMKAAGWSPGPDVRSGLMHLRWLAQHQCRKWTYGQCKPKVDKSNVASAIERLAELLPLTLRNARGRRSK